MMHKLVVSFSIFLLVLAAGAASATTMVLASDGDLFDQAALILKGTVLSASPAASGRPATEYRVQVDRVFKGRVPGDIVVVRVPGGTGADGMTLKIWGAPELRAGERALLFLGTYGDGAYGPLHLAMGAFREVRLNGRHLALRDLSEMEDVSGTVPDSDGARDFGRFARWMEDRAAGLKRSADYFVPGEIPGLRTIHEKFTYLGGVHQRWVEFDHNESIGWRAHNAGQPGLTGGGIAQFQAGIAVWNGDPATNIRYRYDGRTGSEKGFTDFDGINTILFTDVNNEAPGSFQCSAPGTGFGVLALGGTWTLPSEPEPRAIAGADIIINDGAGCWFSTRKRAEQVYAHELGHTLGLGHSCGDSRSGSCNTTLKNEALMRASAHVDDRGARLNGDDRAGILSLYGFPATPSGLTAEPASGTVIRLEWRDNSDNETEFLIERSSPAGGFSLLASVPAGTTAYEAAGLTPGTPYTFRVRARNAAGPSPYSNRASASTPDGSGPCIAGAETLCLAGSRFGVEVQWRTGEAHGAGKVVPNSDQTGMVWFFDASNIELIVKVLDGRPVNGAFWVFYGGLSDVEYWITVTDHQTGRSRTYHNEQGNLCGDADTNAFPEAPGGAGAAVAALEKPASPAATALPLSPAVPCTAAPETLCLFGNRFQVTVSWRLGDGTEGTGKAVPLAGTERTGLFWFFNGANIELVVKMIDGTPVNGRLWFFYGALSNVEYEIEVFDTQTGATRTYQNPAGNLCGQGDTEAFQP